MKPEAVLSRLEKLAFEAHEAWDGSYCLRINRQISGLPKQLAHDLTSALNEAVTMVRLLLKSQIIQPKAEAQLALELDKTNNGSGTNEPD